MEDTGLEGPRAPAGGEQRPVLGREAAPQLHPGNLTFQKEKNDTVCSNSLEPDSPPAGNDEDTLGTVPTAMSPEKVQPDVLLPKGHTCNFCASNQSQKKKKSHLGGDQGHHGGCPKKSDRRGDKRLLSSSPQLPKPEGKGQSQPESPAQREEEARDQGQSATRRHRSLAPGTRL